MAIRMKKANIVWVILILSIIGLGQSNSKSLDKKNISLNESDELLVLEAKLDKKQYTFDESLVLVFKLKNESNYTVVLFDTIPERSFEISLTNEKGENIPLSKEGNKKKYPDIIMARESLYLEPGKQLEWKVDLKTLFDINKAGIYTVTVERLYFIQDSTKEQVQRSRSLISSKPIQFEIVGIGFLIQTDKKTNDDFQLDKNNSDDYLLSISNSDLKFKQGDKIQIEITLKNKTKEEIYFFRGGEIEDIFLEIKDKKGELVSQLRNGIPKTGSRYLVELKPDEEYKFVLNLSDLYDLKKGKYTLAVSRGMYRKDKKTEFYAKLRAVKLIISS